MAQEYEDDERYTQTSTNQNEHEDDESESHYTQTSTKQKVNSPNESYATQTSTNQNEYEDDENESHDTQISTNKNIFLYISIVLVLILSVCIGYYLLYYDSNSSTDMSAIIQDVVKEMQLIYMDRSSFMKNLSRTLKVVANAKERPKVIILSVTGKDKLEEFALFMSHLKNVLSEKKFIGSKCNSFNISQLYREIDRDIRAYVFNQMLEHHDNGIKCFHIDGFDQLKKDNDPYLLHGITDDSKSPLQDSLILLTTSFALSEDSNGENTEKMRKANLKQQLKDSWSNVLKGENFDAILSRIFGNLLFF